jgi:FlaA1/EpsC-like NDP-sugar epimerase
MVIMLGAYLTVFSVRTVGLPSPAFSAVIAFSWFAILVMLGMLLANRVYHRLWAQTSGHGIVVIVRAVFLATVVIALANLLIQPRPIPLSVVVVGNTLAMSGFIAVRYRSRLITGASWRWRAVWWHEFPESETTIRTLIIGAGESGQELAIRLKYRFPDNDYQIIGFVDDAPDKQGMYVEGCRVLGTHTDIPDLVKTHRIELIVVAIHNVAGPIFRDVLSYCEKTTARIKVVPDIFALVNSKYSTELLRDVQPQDLIGRTVIEPYHAVDLTPLHDKAILVTGAAGSIGAELSRQLPNHHPARLILLDNNESGLHDLVIELAPRFPDQDIVPVLADISIKETLAAVFAEHHPQVVFHAAAYKHVPMLELHPDEALRVNIIGTYYLLELAEEYAVERFVLISTDKAVNPSSIMGASKRVCELLAGTFAQKPGTLTRFSSVRFGNVLGSRGSVVSTFSRQIESGGPITITHRDMTRYFMSIPEAINLVIHAACMTLGGDIFLLQMGEHVRILDLAERMIRLRGMRPYDDIDITYTGIRPGEKLSEILYSQSETPVETIHPHIVRVDDARQDFRPSLFLRQLDTLVEHGFNDTGHPMQELLNLISFEYHANEINSV